MGGALPLTVACRWLASSSSRWSPSAALLQADLPHRPYEAGQRWAWDGVRFDLLHPASGLQGDKPMPAPALLRIRDAEGPHRPAAG